MLKQRTIKSLVQTTGIGLHSGKKVYLTLRPAGIDQGIVFRRTDVPSPDIKIQADSVISTQLATMIASPEAPAVTLQRRCSSSGKNVVRRLADDFIEELVCFQESQDV